MAGIQDILSMLPVEDIAKKLGVDPAVAAQAVREGGSAILGGLGRNAEDGDGAAAIDQALAKHADATLDPERVDTADGQKILGHIFGQDSDAVAQKLTSDDKTAGIDFAKLLPILAPIVMGLLAKGKQGQASAQDPTATTAGAAQGGGIGDLIGGLLGGLGGSSGGASAGGIDIGGILGGLFGKK